MCVCERMSQMNTLDINRLPLAHVDLYLLCAQDRLIYLDAAEDFVAKARRFYPPKDDDDDDEEEENPSRINLPLLLSRMNQNISGGEDDEGETTSPEE